MQGGLEKLKEVVPLREVPSSAYGKEWFSTDWKPTFGVAALPKKDLVVQPEPAVSSCHKEGKLQTGLH